MIDLIFLTHNRLEFTKATLVALERNTNWNLVDQFILYDDNSTDGTREYLANWARKDTIPSKIVQRFSTFGHPVNAMRDYLDAQQRHSIFAKVDNDTMCPPMWLDDCFDVMERHPELDLLGIEAMNGVDASERRRGYTEARFIGGIGLMRTRAFDLSRPEPNGPYFGFTEWQEMRPSVTKGWLDPALPVFLLDKMPFEPWVSLSDKYIRDFGQRQWPKYSTESRELWAWWKT